MSYYADRNTVVTQRNSGVVGFLGMLTLLFVAFRLLGVIHWSWWWVLAPIWITAVVGFIIIALIIVLELHADNVYNKKRSGK